MYRSFVPLALALVFTPAVASALEVRGYDAAQHSRFYNVGDKAFIADGYDLSGVGRMDNGAWLTMISPNYFLAANHFGVGLSVTFRASNLQSSAVGYDIDTGFRQILKDDDGSDGDLYLGRLTGTGLDPADGIATYAIPQLGANSNYLGQTMFVYGRGDGVGTDTDRVGRNTIDELDVVDVEGTDGFCIVSFYDSTPGDTYLQGRDSGAPNFLDFDGQLALVGVNWFTGFTEETIRRPVSGGSFVPYYADQLEDLMNGQTITLVPEPVTLALIAFATLPALLRPRRI